MSSWAGFTDDELRRIQEKDPPVHGAARGRGRKAAPTNRTRLQREKALQLPAAPEGPGASVPAEQRLGSAQPAKELDKRQIEEREKSRLEQLQLEQRLMEEENKRKKAFLTKTIAEKSKQTQAEAVKLKRIQKELQVLDDSVSSDINILRGLIEQASLEYSAAWKRFEKAEAEYVSAKMDLHHRTEVKERLTEHLCAIIQQNELRKAGKLEELMLQLEPGCADGPQGPDPSAGTPPS
ncbi:RAB6-interacting golgin isoform X2 [Denticeps clupeoides]|uniref:RAB6-interacting golgin isoform X2 n=1 Tax=Denticeps clupeoides TaxID=299321 RepID=UPI0010A4593E|nr:RAB6-interacting golgin isoform X2 [Denticeps clupeoides]